MKLSEESHGGSLHSLEEDPQERELFLTRHLRRMWRFLISSRGITLFWAVVTFGCISFLLSMDYLAMVKIAENDISSQDVYAPYDMEVEDRSETLVKQQHASQDVLPVFEPVQEKNNEVRENQAHLFRSLDTLRLDSSKDLEEKKSAFINLVGDQPGNARVAEKLFRRPPAVQMDRVRYLSQVTTDRILQDGLTPSDYVNNREEVIHKAMPTRGVSLDEAEVTLFLVGSNIRPNRIIDEAAWETSKAQAVKKVKPEYKVFRKGQKIIGKGEILTPLRIDALETMGKSVIGVNWLACLGVMILTAIYTGTLWGYLYHYEGRQYFRPPYAALLTTLTITIITLVKVSIQNQLQMVALPLASYALLVTIFTHPRIGVLATTLLIFLVGITLKLDFSVLSMLLFGSVVGIYILSRRMNFSDRTQLMSAGVYVGITNAIVLGALMLLGAGPYVGIQLNEVAAILGYGMFISGILSGMLTFGALPYLESMFGLITPFTLMELGNHDKPLLKRMQFEAPGTFHHSIMVSTLSEACAEAIGANPLLARVGALYHDIGKMKRPLFFIENQAYFGVENPHDRLTPRLSKMVVTAHPRDSVEMARQYRLPEVLTKFMKEHHGTLVAGYFYNQACIHEGEENVNKSQFRYPGPKPDIKETAICMLCDACESAVRALKNPSPAQIEERVEKIIRQRVDDGQFDNCAITFKDVNTIKETIIRVLRGIQHNRIEYQETVMRELGRKIPELPILPDIRSLESRAKHQEQD